MSFKLTFPKNNGQQRLVQLKECSQNMTINNPPQKCVASQRLTKCLDDIVSLPFTYMLRLTGRVLWLFKSNGVWT